MSDWLFGHGSGQHVVPLGREGWGNAQRGVAFGNGTGIQSGIRGSYRIYGSSLTALSCSSEINLEIFQVRRVG